MPPPGGLREIIVRIALVALSTLTTLAAVETAFRKFQTADVVSGESPLYFGQDQAAYQIPLVVANRIEERSLPTTYRYRPNTTWATLHRLPGAVMKIDYFMNNAGFRDTDFIRNKDTKTYRIAILGDSVTMGQGVPQGRTLADLLEQRLRERLPDIEVFNFGINGYDTLDILQLLHQEVMPCSPDLVVYNFYPNDISRVAFESLGRRLTARRFRLRGVIASPYRLVRYIAVRAIMLSEDRETLATYRNLYRNPSATSSLKSALAEMRQRTGSSGARFVVTLLPDLSGFDGKWYRLQWVHDLMRDWLASARIEFADLAENLGDHPRQFAISDSDAHPNQEGHQIIADQLFSLLERNHHLP